MLSLPTPDAMSAEAWAVAAVALWMALWWAGEAIPVPATALLPLVLFPLLGIAPIEQAAAPYANPLIFLFLGGFALALGVQRWDLHRRIALAIVHRIGGRPPTIVAGFMVAAAVLSMWVSNTATTMMMLPIALSVIGVFLDREPGADDREGRNFATACVLGVAYGASVGGLGTLIGTPPNALLAAYMSARHGVEIGFAAWLGLGLPLVILLLPITWWVLTRLVYPFELPHTAAARAVVEEGYRARGPMSGPEKRVAAVFALTAAAWIGRPWLEALPGLGGLSDPVIALVAGLLLFALPSGAAQGGRLLDWAALEKLPWGILILFGGGLSLAGAIEQSGLAAWLGGVLTGFADWPPVLLVAAVVALVVFLTELTSNTATAATFLPIVAALAGAAHLAPLELAAPAALAASCAFMLPVATPPNAIVYGSGHVTLPQMARAGLWLNLVAIVLLSLIPAIILPVLFGAP